MRTIPFRYDPAVAALIVIDIQNDFCSPNGSLARLGHDTLAAQEMLPRLQYLLAAARALNLPVIFVRTLHDESTDSPQWLGRLGDGPGTERTRLTCRPGTWGSEFFGVTPEEGDNVVTKNRFSGFVGTNLDLLLRTRGIESLLFAGVTTETCVESTLREGLFHEYYVSLVADCAASYSVEAHAASVSTIAANFGTVINALDLIRLWDEGQSTSKPI
jgi:nicotinamidase-related amidase